MLAEEGRGGEGGGRKRRGRRRRGWSCCQLHSTVPTRLHKNLGITDHNPIIGEPY